MATVELSNLAKRFGDFTALENLNLSISDGEFLVLLGPSGCGKSTTMRLVAGLEEPTSGDILIGGKRMNDTPARVTRSSLRWFSRVLSCSADSNSRK